MLRGGPISVGHVHRRTHQRWVLPLAGPEARFLLEPIGIAIVLGPAAQQDLKLKNTQHLCALPTTMTQHPIESFLHQDLTSLDHAQQQDPALWVLLGRQTQQSGVGLSHSKSDPVIDLKKTSRPAGSTHNSDDPEKIQKRPFFFNFFPPTLKWRDGLKNQKLKKINKPPLFYCLEASLKKY